MGPKPKRKTGGKSAGGSSRGGFSSEVVAVVDSPLEVVAVVDSHQEAVVVAVSHQEVVVVEVPVETVEVDSEEEEEEDFRIKWSGNIPFCTLAFLYTLMYTITSFYIQQRKSFKMFD